MFRRFVGSAIFAAVLLGSQLSLADDWRPTFSLWHPGMKPVDGNPAASLDQVANSVGDVSAEVVCPSPNINFALKRGVRLTVGKSGDGYRDPGVLSTLLFRALDTAWSQCNTQMGSFGFSVGFAEIYAPNGPSGAPVLVARADQFIDIMQSWQTVTDVGAQQEQAAAEAAAQQQAEQQQQAQAAQQAAQQAQAAQEAAANQAQQQAAQAAAAAQQTQVDEQNRQQAALESARQMHQLWVFVQWCIPLGVALFLFSRRAILARWYYFYFHPHPAAPLVRAALSTGNVLDGKALAHALSEVPPGSAVFRAVRLEQAELLFHQMQAASAAHLRRQEQQAKSEAQRAYERAALNSIQEAVALAAVALERAKALYRASQQVGATL